MASWLEDMFTGPDGLFSPKTLVPAVGAVYSGWQSGQANQRAAELAQQGQAANLRAIQGGVAGSQARYDAITNNAAPANTYLRTVMATDPNELTLQQQNQLAEVRRQTANQLNAGPLSGSGQAITGAIRKVDSQTQGDMIAQNRARADNAAGVLSGQGNTASMASAGVPFQAGQLEGRGAVDASNTAANATVATAGTNASTLAALAGYVNRDAATRDIGNRYKTVAPGSA